METLRIHRDINTAFSSKRRKVQSLIRILLGATSRRHCGATSHSCRSQPCPENQVPRSRYPWHLVRESAVLDGKCADSGVRPSCSSSPLYGWDTNTFSDKPRTAEQSIVIVIRRSLVLAAPLCSVGALVTAAPIPSSLPATTWCKTKGSGLGRFDGKHVHGPRLRMPRMKNPTNGSLLPTVQLLTNVGRCIVRHADGDLESAHHGALLIDFGPSSRRHVAALVGRTFTP
jgi:hypothetical protein